ncbi:hypothetical protein RSP822_18070 [Ralstonia solanacearum]|nr:hypothetical protein RSP822_18070 [Ralstonia solanacearum]
MSQTETTRRWVVDAYRPLGNDGWVYNYAVQHFESEADALRWIETYRPYEGASKWDVRAIAA